METFIVETHLNVRPYQFRELMKAFNYARIVYLRLLSYEKKKLAIFDNIDEVKSLKEKLSCVKDPLKKKKIQAALSYYRKQCDLKRFDIIKDVNLFYKEYKNYITSQMAQSIAKRIDAAITEYIEEPDIELSNTKVIKSIESESTINGIKFDGTNVIYKDMLLPIKVKNDSYFYEALQNYKLQYIRIVKRTGKTKTYMNAQFVFVGEPISKRKIKLGNGDVGIDLGTSTIAYCSENEVKIEEFSKELVKVDNEISLINQKLDRSRRTNNPKNYYEDGQIVPKEERLPWKNSKTYKRLLRRKRYLSNKLTNQRKNLYEHQVNELLTKGNRFIIEDMNYKALQKRKKETTKDDKGRFEKKSRYGKSLLEHAPSSFVNILIRKLGYLGIQIYKVNNQTFKASQYDHTKDEYIKCDLNVRKKNIGNNIVQRDLYSAFFLMNANDDLQTVNKEKCNERFNKFLSLHEIEINRLSKQTNISCIGV